MSRENNVGKGEIADVTSNSSFPTMFSEDLYCRHIKTRACFNFGKGLKDMTSGNKLENRLRSINHIALVSFVTNIEQYQTVIYKILTVCRFSFFTRKAMLIFNVFPSAIFPKKSIFSQAISFSPRNQFSLL